MFDLSTLYVSPTAKLASQEMKSYLDSNTQEKPSVEKRPGPFFTSGEKCFRRRGKQTASGPQGLQHEQPASGAAVAVAVGRGRWRW